MAVIISHFTDKDYSSILNDIYRVKSHPAKNSELLQSVRSLLNDWGYQIWLEQN